MEDRNAEAVARWAQAAGRGDVAVDLWHPEAVIVNAEGWAVEATYEGHDGVQRWWADIAEAFSDVVIAVDGIERLDADTFLTEQRLTGHFRTTGIQMDAPWASVVTVQDGRIKRAEGFMSRARALQALGRAVDE